MKSRRPPLSGRRRPAGLPGDMVREYAALCDKYRDLVDKYDADAGRKSSVTLLALAAMRAGLTALAALRDGRCIVRNERWVWLASQQGAPWRLARSRSAPGQAQEYPTLEALALAQAAELSVSRETARAARVERGAGEAIVELRLERTRVGEPPVVLALVMDVTERVRSEREVARTRRTMEAQERLRAVGELASGIAHDLNNTLHALRLRLSRLSACVGGCAEHAEDLRVVERIASDAGARVRRLQDLAGRREDVPDERVDLAAVVAGAVELARPHVSDPARRVSFEVNVPELPHVVGTAAELADVLVSLFVNARDAMPTGGRISVSGTSTPERDVEITVADQGRGIPAENLERIFDPFFTTKGRRGTGLGLSTAAGVLRRLGGAIRAENAPGGGAVFTLRFPPAPAIASPRAPAVPRVRDVVPRRVLVVDDDADNLDAMRLVLSERGHHVEVTESGLDAVSRVEAGERYDTVLCDLGLADATGWDVAARIGAAAPGTRILLVTGWAEEIPADDPRRGFVARVLSKPLGIAELQEIMREPLAPRPAPAQPSERAEPLRADGPSPDQ
jgi:signal transduction histidine kinase/ActR/RegA family two-component response regulator